MLYFIVFFVLIFFTINIQNGVLAFSKKMSKAKYITLFFLLLMIIGFRDRMVGADTNTYVSEFEGNAYLSFETFFSNFGGYNEPLFALFTYLIRRITSKYVFYLLCFAIPISLGVSFLIYRESSHGFLSIALFSALGFFTFAMAGVRQTAALGFCMIAYFYANKKKFIPFLVFVIIAYLFHNTALIFLPVYFLNKIKPKNYVWIIIGIFLVLGITKNNKIINFFSSLFINERYSMYGNEYTSVLSLTMFFVQLLLFIFCWVYKDAVIKNDRSAKLLYNMALIGVCFQALTPMLGEFFRISMYFSYSFILLVPKVIDSIKDKQDKIIFAVTIAFVSIVYFFISNISIISIYRFSF